MKQHIPQIALVGFMVLALTGIWAFQYVPAGEFTGYFKAQLMGQSASVEENPFNRLAQQFEEREKELEQKEVELNRKEEFLLQEIQDKQERRNQIVIAAVIVIGLIVFLNFFMDWRREKREEGLLRSILSRMKSNAKE